MKLKNLLLEKRSDILRRWFDLILETYPADTVKFLKAQKNPFANPVGQTILRGIEGLFENLLDRADSNPDVTAATFLENIIRIRAVQDFNPSQALSFVFLLKKVIREEMRGNTPSISGPGNEVVGDLLALESKIDELALLSFDIFMECREKIYDLKSKELQNRTFRLLQRANLISDSESSSAEGGGQYLKDSKILTKT